MRINFNVNREYDSYLPPISTVSNSESFEASTSDKKLSKASSSEISSEDEKYFERTMTADKAESVFQQPQYLSRGWDHGIDLLRGVWW